MSNVKLEIMFPKHLGNKNSKIILQPRLQRYLPIKVPWTNMDKEQVLQTTTASAMFFFDLLKVVTKINIIQLVVKNGDLPR